MNVQRAVLISCPAATNRRTYGKPWVEMRTVPLSKNGKHPSLVNWFMVQTFSIASLHAQRNQKCFLLGLLTVYGHLELHIVQPLQVLR